MSHDRARLRALLAAAMVLTSLALVVPTWATASAQTTTLPPAVSAEFDAVNAFVERGGIPNGRPPVGCVTVCDDLWLSEHRPMPNQPSSDALHRELQQARRRAKLLPRIATLGRVSLVGSAFAAGWVVGTEVRKVFLTSGMPAQSGAIYHAAPVEAGATIPGAPVQELVAPTDGWYGQGSCGAPGCAGEASEYEGHCTPLGPLRAAYAGWSWVSVPQYFNFNCGPVLLRSESFRSSPIRVEEYTGQTGNQPAITWPTFGDPGTNGEPAATTRDRLRGELENNSNSYPTLIPWLDAHLGGDSEDPTGQLVRLPACRGDSYAACAARLEARGLRALRVELDFEGADLGVPADAVIRTEPARQAPAGSEVRVQVNPDAANMPAVVPSIEPDETYEDFADRLRELELAPVREDTTEITFSHHADGAMRTAPGTGARVRKDTEVRVITRPRRQRCDLSDPADEFVLDDGHEPFEPFLGGVPRYSSLAVPTFFTPLSPEGLSTTLRWGNITGFDANWAGFGYRHVEAKHGWSPADDAATREALNSSSGVPEGGGVNRRLFVGPEYPSPKDGRPCVRFVVVEYGSPPGQEEPPAGIITSYGGDPRQ